MTAFLPELVTDILLRLPVESLLRFRCLSTSHCTEIDSPHFVNNHLNRSIQTKTRRKLIIRSSNADFYAADFDDGLRDAFLLNNPLKYPNRYTFVCGSCNGLILLGIIVKEQQIDLVLWNPFTRRHKKLPICPVQTLPGNQILFSLGLGFDSAHDDYKAVMISKVHDSKQVWVFSLKSNSWRRSQDQDLGDNLTWVGIFANGALYWECVSSKFYVGFDLANEVFFKLPLVSLVSGPRAVFYINLMDFEGQLCVPVLLADHETIEIYLYVNGEGGEVAGGSWRKEFIVKREGNDNPFLALPLAYSEEVDSILLGKGNEIFWYNLEKKTRQRMEIHGISGSPAYNYHVYCESLVSVGNDSAFDGAVEGRNC